MCPKSFSWAKKKENFFPTGSREDRSEREWHLTVLNQQKRKQITPILGIHFLKVQTTIGQNKIKIHGILLA